MNKKLFEEIKEGLDSITEEMAEKLLNSISHQKSTPTQYRSVVNSASLCFDVLLYDLYSVYTNRA